MTQKNSIQKKDETLAILTHAMGIFVYLFGALLVFLLTKDSRVKKHARLALNWQISLAIYYVFFLATSSISAILMGGFPNIYIIFPFGLILSGLVVINIIFSIIASVKANEGEYWKYPLSLNMIEKIGEKKINKGKRELRKVYKEIKGDLKKRIED